MKLKPGNRTITRLRERTFRGVFLVCALACVLAVALICVFLFIEGVPGISKIGLFKFLFGKVWRPSTDTYGIFPMILGSLCVTAGALLFGVPIAFFTSVYLARFCPKKIYRFLKPLTQLLAGIPSVVYGFFGLVVLVPAVRGLFGGSGSSMFTASLLLGLMILPTIIGVSEAAVSAVPESYYEGGLALGATHERSVFFASLPAAKSGVAAAVVLGLGRAVGETMAVIMVAGNQARMPNGLFRGIRTMTANIAMEMGYSADLHREALIATGVVLFVFILLVNLALALIKRRAAK